MIVLAMDTSSVNATVAVCNENKILGEYTISSERAHSQMIMPMLENMLSSLSMTVKDVDVFAVCLGPGSFTGVRIGMAAMKTLAQTLSKPIVGISATESVAASFPISNKYICPIFDARRNDVYNAVYLNGEEITGDRIIDFDELLREMNDKEVIFAGDAVLKYKDIIDGFDNPKWHIAPMNLSMQRASSLAFVALERAKKNDFDNLYELSPIYIRLSQAEREYNIAHGISDNI